MRGDVNVQVMFQDQVKGVLGRKTQATPGRKEVRKTKPTSLGASETPNTFRSPGPARCGQATHSQSADTEHTHQQAQSTESVKSSCLFILHYP